MPASSSHAVSLLTPGRDRVRLDVVALTLCAKLWHSLDLADCWVSIQVDGSPQWRVIGGCTVTQLVWYKGSFVERWLLPRGV